MSNQIKERFGGRFMAGCALIGVGALLVLQRAGMLHALDVQRGWPIVLIVLAIAQLGATFREVRQRGWGLLLLADWLLLNTMTDWALAQITWPVLLTFAGVWMIVRSVSHHAVSGPAVSGPAVSGPAVSHCDHGVLENHVAT